MIWNHDMSAAPRDPKIRLLVAHPKDGKVYLTKWNEPTPHTPQGWWSGFAPGFELLAWMPWPEHPNIHRGEPREADAPKGERKPAATLTGAEGFVPPAETAAVHFILDDVGSGA